MTVEATISPDRSSESNLRARALDAIRGEALLTILESDEPLRTADIARSVAERLDLELTEEETGGLAQIVRMVLDSDPLFSQANRQWDLALRMGRAEGDRRKPVERALMDFFDLIGHPAPVHPVAVLAAAVYGRQPDYYEQMLSRLVESERHFFSVGRGLVGPSRWLVDVSAGDPEDVEWNNFEDDRTLRALREAASGVEGSDAAEFARALIAKSGGADNRALQFLVWLKFPDVDPRALFRLLFRDGSLALERGPLWVPYADHQAVLDAVKALTREPDELNELVASTAPAEEEEIAVLAPTAVRVSDDDLEQVYEFMSQEDRSYRVAELCQQALEAFPGSRTYAGVYESLTNRLKEDSRFAWVGAERFRIAGTIPADITAVPDGLEFDDRVYGAEEEGETERILDPQDWKFNLDEQILHYLVQDVGDDGSPRAVSPPQAITVSPPLHHYVAGTLYLRNSDRGFFPAQPELVQVGLNAGDQRFEVWVNNRLGVVFGLKEWYDANLPWVGGQFRIERTEQPDEYRLAYSGEVEPLMDLSLDRLQQLLTLRPEAEAGSILLPDLVQRLLKAHPEGVHFATLFTELNVVRRTRRARLASALSSQRFFSQNPQEPGIWSYDEKRAQKVKGKKKGGPRRPMREMYDEDEDEEFEYE